MRYSGEQCPVCEREFELQSDIVVCPECGTPHHRKCWEEFGKCKNSQLHASGFVYENNIRELKGVKVEDKNTHSRSGKSDTRASHTIYATDAYGFFNNEPISPETDIAGISGKEYETFLGSATYRYLPRFVFLQKTGRKITVNLFALLFPFTFAANKRMYKLAVILLALDMLFFGLGAFSLVTKEPFKAVIEVFVQITADGTLTESEHELFNEAVEKLNQTEIETGPLDFILRLGIIDNIFMGFFATFLYMIESEKKIKKLKDYRLPRESFDLLLKRLGKGVYTLPVMGYIAIFFEVLAILSFGFNM